NSGDPRCKLATQAVAHHPAPRYPSDVYAIWIDPVGRLDPIDQRRDELDVVHAGVVTAAISIPPVAVAVGVRRYPSQAMRLDVKGAHYLGWEAAAVRPMEDDHQRRRAGQPVRPINAVVALETVLVERGHLRPTVRLGEGGGQQRERDVGQIGGESERGDQGQYSD